MSVRKWAVRHPGIGVLHYDSEEEARVAAGTAGEMLGEVPVCSAEKHGSPTAFRVHGCRCPETVVLMTRYRHGIVVDEARVLRACEGERLWLNIRERGEAVRVLSLRRMSAAQIGARLHLSERAVQRYIRKLLAGAGGG
jgi:DNA-binding CsgD family transcriptional regulator